MQSSEQDVAPVIGMSPGNSYFKDAEVSFLLKKIVEKYGKAAILVADIPAISTYIAFGYPENRARSKAVLKGNNLKNRTRRIQKELGYTSDQVIIIDWESDVENDPVYVSIYRRIAELYQSCPAFQEAVDATTEKVIQGSLNRVTNITAAVKIAVHYLLSELAFLEFAPTYFKSKHVVYVYHKNWPVYEEYIAGKFDQVPKLYLDFLLAEHPKEMYKSLEQTPATGPVHVNSLQSIREAGILRTAFSNYPPSFIEHSEDRYSGIFYEILLSVAHDLGVRLELVEEVGYGAVVGGLSDGRFDIFCSAVWPTETRQDQAIFSKPVYSSNVYMWVRQGEDKEKYENIQENPFFRIAVKENDIDSIAQSKFPKARRVWAPQLLDPMGLLEFVAQDKADATFQDPYLVKLFNEQSSQKLLTPNTKPVAQFSNSFMLGKGSTELLGMVNNTIDRMKASGELEDLILKYVGSRDAFDLTNDMILD